MKPTTMLYAKVRCQVLSFNENKRYEIDSKKIAKPFDLCKLHNCNDTQWTLDNDNNKKIKTKTGTNSKEQWKQNDSKQAVQWIAFNFNFDNNTSAKISCLLISAYRTLCGNKINVAWANESHRFQAKLHALSLRTGLGRKIVYFDAGSVRMLCLLAKEDNLCDAQEIFYFLLRTKRQQFRDFILYFCLRRFQQ